MYQAKLYCEDLRVIKIYILEILKFWAKKQTINKMKCCSYFYLNIQNCTEFSTIMLFKLEVIQTLGFFYFVRSLTYAMVLCGSQSIRSSSTERRNCYSGHPTEVNRRNGNIRWKYKTDCTVYPITSKNTHKKRAKSHKCSNS